MTGINEPRNETTATSANQKGQGAPRKLQPPRSAGLPGNASPKIRHRQEGS